MQQKVRFFNHEDRGTTSTKTQRNYQPELITGSSQFIMNGQVVKASWAFRSVSRTRTCDQTQLSSFLRRSLTHLLKPLLACLGSWKLCTRAGVLRLTLLTIPLVLNRWVMGWLNCHPNPPTVCLNKTVQGGPGDQRGNNELL